MTERVVSWLSVTQVLAAWTGALAASVASMAARNAEASNVAWTNWKWNASGISSGRRNSATVSASAPVSMTAMRSPGYDASTRRAAIHVVDRRVDPLGDHC
ncbi:MAG: hypothetical protein U0838_08385 [Chloroflexota bacterium]